MADVTFYENPEYKALLPDFIRYRDLFDGDQGVMTSESYLWSHEFEMSGSEAARTMRNLRVQRSQYVNLIAPIVKRYISLIFKNEIDFSEIEDVIPAEERADIDGNGTSLSNFIMNDVAGTYFLYGRPMVLVDSFGVSALNRSEEIEAGARPYMEVLNPLEVLDWSIETATPGRKGKLNFVRCEYVMVEPRVSATQAPIAKLYSKVFTIEDGRYVQRLYSAGEVSKAKKNSADGWLLEGEFFIPLEEIPISRIFDVSWCKALAPIALLRHNTQSSLDNQLLFQAHQRLLATGNFDSQSEAVASVGSITTLPEGATVQVVEPSVPQSLEKRLETLTMDLYRVAFSQTRPMPADSRQTQAAEALRESKDEFIATLEAAGSDLEDLVNESVRNYAAFKGVDNFDGRVHFDLEITLDDVEQQILIATAFADQIRRHPTWQKELLKKIARYQGLNNGDEIVAEIDSTPSQATGGPLTGFLANAGQQATEG